MAWTEYDPPNGNDVLQLYVQFKGGTALGGEISVYSSESPSEAQYQGLVDAIKASSLIQNVYITDTVPVVRTLEATPIPPGDDS